MKYIILLLFTTGLYAQNFSFVCDDGSLVPFTEYQVQSNNTGPLNEDRWIPLTFEDGGVIRVAAGIRGNWAYAVSGYDHENEGEPIISLYFRWPTENYMPIYVQEIYTGHGIATGTFRAQFYTGKACNGCELIHLR